MTLPRHVLIDLDGTLLDPKRGIFASFQAGLAAVGAPPAPIAALDAVIGPPLRKSFGAMGVAAGLIEDALAGYRHHYTGGTFGTDAPPPAAAAMFDADLYPGIADALDALRADGCHLLVATSKPHVYARPILGHFDLASRFTAIHGAELDGRRDDKGELIELILTTAGIDPSDAVMIGDRHFDGVGARRNGIPFVGVLWGYGDRTELTAAGARGLAETPDQLVATLRAALA